MNGTRKPVADAQETLADIRGAAARELLAPGSAVACSERYTLVYDAPTGHGAS